MNSLLIKSCLRRLAVLAFLTLTFTFLLVGPTPSPVKADDCSDAFLNYSTCEYYCYVQYDYCVSHNLSGCTQAIISCLTDCGQAHLNFSTTCSMPSHTPMIDQNASCEANGDRLYDNCMAGTLGTLWRNQYLACMAGYTEDGHMIDCCEALRADYLDQGCY